MRAPNFLGIFGTERPQSAKGLIEATGLTAAQAFQVHLL
jgi:hypothetical protein